MPSEQDIGCYGVDSYALGRDFASSIGRVTDYLTDRMLDQPMKQILALR